MKENNVLIAYIAGVMDGDGSFSVGKLGTSRNPLYFPMLQCTSCLNFIDILKETFGGSIHTYKKRLKKNGDLGRLIRKWSIRSFCNVKPVLEAVIPFLRIKKERAEFLLKFIDSHVFIRGKILSAEDIAIRESFYLKMIQFNDWKSCNGTITKKLCSKNSEDPCFWSYIAGIMDTDGSFSLKKQVINKGTHVINPRYIPIISLSMTDISSINFIRENCTFGKLCIPKNIWTNSGIHYQFSIFRKQECIEFLRKIIPFLKSKKSQAETLLYFFQNVCNVKYCKGGIPSEELIFRESVYQHMIQLNQYGVSKSSLMDLKLPPDDAEDNKAEGASHRERSKREDHESGCGALNIAVMQ